MPELDLNSAQFFDLARQILTEGHALRFRARGVSMRPFIQDGDLLEVRFVPATDIKVGNVVLFGVGEIPGKQNASPSSLERSDLPVTILVHRILRIRGSGREILFFIQGDAALLPDGWISPAQVLGRVSAFERNGKTRSLNTLPQRLLSLCLAWGLPLYKAVHLKFLSRQED